jgi:hypothetical protein
MHSVAGTTSGTPGTISSLFFDYGGWGTDYQANHQTVKISHVGSATKIENGPTGSGPIVM